MSAKSHWGELHRRFDPEEPVVTDAWHATREYNTAEEILNGLNRAWGDNKFLLMGTVGTGKSTELHRIANARSKKSGVIFFDIFQHFQRTISDPQAIQHVQPWEVLILIGLAVHGSAERFKLNWDPQLTKNFELASKAMISGSASPSAEIDVAKLAGVVSTVVGGLAAGPIGELAGSVIKVATDATEWKIQFGVGGKRSPRDQDVGVQSLLKAVNELIRELQQQFGSLTIFVDGLDRITNAETTRELFVESALLGNLACATVVTGPLPLLRERIVVEAKRFRPKILANVPVLDRQDPRKQGKGCQFFIELFQRRTSDLPAARAALSDEQLKTLAYYSGGRSRDFVRFIALVAEHAHDDGLMQADDSVVHRAIEERRKIMEAGLNREHYEILKSVVQDPKHLLPGSDTVPMLLDQWCLLPYPNESEWYFPHTLLTIHQVTLG